MGYFELVAAVDRLPDSSDYEYVSESLTAFNKILILPKLKPNPDFDSASDSSYEILI